MSPSIEQVRVAAYHRWERRGYPHGQDRRDWLAAEQDLRLSLNYDVVARHRLDGTAPRVLGDPARPRCRFCEQAAPRADFCGPWPAVPGALGDGSLRVAEQCDDCRSAFADGIDADLDNYVQALLNNDDAPPSIGAYKGLVRVALALAPAGELDAIVDVVEWVANPDHELDGAAVGDLSVLVGRWSEPWPFAWAILSRRSADDSTLPYMLISVGVGRIAFSASVPLCTLDDDDRGGRPTVAPRTFPPSGDRPRPDPEWLSTVTVAVAAEVASRC